MATQSIAQAPDSVWNVPVRFEQVSGLSHNTVYSILQDRQGYLWIGTEDGLNRYDGYGFTVYRHDPRDSTTLWDNTIRSLDEDEEGNLWIGTAGGLNRLDRASNNFKRYRIRNDDARLDVAMVTAGPDHTLWINTFANVLYRYDTSTQSVLRRWTSRIDTLNPSPHLPNIVYSGGDRFWIAHRTFGKLTDLYAVGSADGRPKRVSLPESLDVKGSFHTGRSGLWWVDSHWIGRFNEKLLGVQPVLRLPDTLMGHSRLLEARYGSLWIGTHAGLYHANPTTGEVHHYRMQAGGTEALSNFVLALYQDRAGAVWVGTRSGLFRYDPHVKPFRHVAPRDAFPVGAGTNTVMAIEEDTADRIWLGTLGGGLLRLHPASGSIRTLVGSRAPENIWALHKDRSGTLWIGGDAGLFSLNTTTGRYMYHDVPSVHPDVHAIYSIAEGTNGSLWLAGPWAVHLFDPAQRRTVLRRDLHFSFAISTIQALHESADGILWIGTEQEGLFRYDPATDVLTHYKTAAVDGTGLAGQAVWAIHKDTSGYLWLGTDLGLARFDPQTETFATYYDEDLMPGAIVYSILEDEQGRLWMGASQGLVRFDPVLERFQHYDESDGIGNREFNRRAALETAGGIFYFGGLNGITTFNPAAIRENSYAPPVVVQHMRVFDGEGAENVSFVGKDVLRLNHLQNTFEIAYTGLNFTDAHKNRYAYQLEGFDADWVEAGGRRQVRYTNVPPGEYVFRVRAANNDGIWNEEGAAIRLAILPPYWQTWWFRFLMVAAVLGLLVAAHKYRVAQVRRVDQLRLRIAGDLHDDIGSKLSSIALMSEMVSRRSALNARAHRQLTDVTQVAREMVNDLRDIVWLTRPRYDTADDLFDKMEETATAMLDGTACHIEYAGEGLSGSLDPERRRQLYLMYKEILHNVAKHAQASRVDIRVRAKGNTLHLEVRDDGIGFDPSTAHRVNGNGLDLLRERARTLGGEVTIESRPGNGTYVILRVRI